MGTSQRLKTVDGVVVLFSSGLQGGGAFCDLADPTFDGSRGKSLGLVLLGGLDHIFQGLVVGHRTLRHHFANANDEVTLRVGGDGLVEISRQNRAGSVPLTDKEFAVGSGVPKCGIEGAQLSLGKRLHLRVLDVFEPFREDLLQLHRFTLGSEVDQGIESTLKQLCFLLLCLGLLNRTHDTLKDFRKRTVLILWAGILRWHIAFRSADAVKDVPVFCIFGFDLLSSRLVVDAGDQVVAIDTGDLDGEAILEKELFAVIVEVLLKILNGDRFAGLFDEGICRNLYHFKNSLLVGGQEVVVGFLFRNSHRSNDRLQQLLDAQVANDRFLEILNGHRAIGISFTSLGQPEANICEGSLIVCRPESKVGVIADSIPLREHILIGTGPTHLFEYFVPGNDVQSGIADFFALSLFTGFETPCLAVMIQDQLTQNLIRCCRTIPSQIDERTKAAEAVDPTGL